MATIKVYTQGYCPYCVRAKNLLTDRGIPFEEVNLDGDNDGLAALKKKTGMRTIPQIFIDDELIGGFQELSALDSSGELEKRMKA